MKTKQETKYSHAELHAELFPVAKIVFESYLEFRNDWLTDWRFAKAKGLSEEFTLALLKEGRRIHRMNDSL